MKAQPPALPPAVAHLVFVRCMRACVRVTVFLILLCSLSSCDVDVFGFDSKRVAGDWRLLRTESGFALMPPHKNVGGYVARIGWQKPFIISRTESSLAW